MKIHATAYAYIVISKICVTCLRRGLIMFHAFHQSLKFTCFEVPAKYEADQDGELFQRLIQLVRLQVNL